MNKSIFYYISAPQRWFTSQEVVDTGWKTIRIYAINSNGMLELMDTVEAPIHENEVAAIEEHFESNGVPIDCSEYEFKQL